MHLQKQSGQENIQLPELQLSSAPLSLSTLVTSTQDFYWVQPGYSFTPQHEWAHKADSDKVFSIPCSETWIKDLKGFQSLPTTFVNSELQPTRPLMLLLLHTVAQTIRTPPCYQRVFNRKIKCSVFLNSALYLPVLRTAQELIAIPLWQ